MSARTKYAGPVTARMILQNNREWAPPDNPGWETATRDLQREKPRIRRLGEKELGFAVGSLLEFELGETLVAGWRAHPAFRSAALATAAKPGSTVLVDLVTHEITSSHRPHVDVEIDGATFTTVYFDIDITARITGLSATVRGGRLVALHSGECEVSVTLTCGGVEVEVGKATLNAPLNVSLADGADLLGQPVATSTVEARRQSRRGVST